MIKYISIRITVVFVFLASFLVGFSQELASDSTDRLTNQSNELLKLVELQRKDSIKRVELENRFVNEDVKSTKEYKELYKEIELLKNKDSILRERRIQKVDSLKLLNKGVPVNPFDSTLFSIYTNIGSFSASDRAKVINERILILTADLKFNPDSLILTEDESGKIISKKIKIRPTDYLINLLNNDVVNGKKKWFV